MHFKYMSVDCIHLTLTAISPLDVLQFLQDIQIFKIDENRFHRWIHWVAVGWFQCCFFLLLKELVRKKNLEVLHTCLLNILYQFLKYLCCNLNACCSVAHIDANVALDAWLIL